MKYVLKNLAKKATFKYFLKSIQFLAISTTFEFTRFARKFLLELIWGFIPLKNDVAGEMLSCTFSSLTQLLLDESSVHHSSPPVSFPIYHQATWKVSESVQKLSAWQMTPFLSTKPCYTWLKNYYKMSHLEACQVDYFFSNNATILVNFPP